MVTTDFGGFRSPAEGKLTIIARWLGRLLGLLGSLFIVMFALGGGNLSGGVSR
jgi:hypothetical protein